MSGGLALWGRGVYAASPYLVAVAGRIRALGILRMLKRPEGRAPLDGSPAVRSRGNSYEGGFPLMRFSFCTLLLLLALLVAFPARAEISAGDFELANRLYGQGKFQEAAAAYEKLLQSGETSAAVCFNLGNACFKSGQIGRALAAYRQAEQFTPRDPDLRANLQFARNQVQGPTVAPDWWQRWLGRLTLNEWTLLAVAAVWVLLLALTLLQVRPAWRPMLKTYLVPLGAAAALLCVCLAAALYSSRFSPTAIVIARNTAVRISPLEESPAAFTAQDGAELRLLDQKDGWLQVNADPRRLGWVRRDQVLLAPGGSGINRR
jgi:tetratricopeptide (TPR) repeat protein